MNCHVVAGNNSDISIFYIRGKNGGAILNRKGVLKKLNIKTGNMISSSVYGHLSPDGKYFVFSTNIIIPGFHADPDKRMEVFDTKSDVYVADLENNKIISSSVLSDSSKLETFPCFSQDGKYIYFCTADALKNISDIENLQYRLVRINFENGIIGNRTDTLVNSTGEKKYRYVFREFLPTENIYSTRKLTTEHFRFGTKKLN